MADDLDDWETADIDATLSKPAPAPVVKPPAFETKGEAIRAQINGPDMSQFEDEDANFTAPVEHAVPAPQVDNCIYVQTQQRGNCCVTDP